MWSRKCSVLLVNLDSSARPLRLSVSDSLVRDANISLHPRKHGIGYTASIQFSAAQVPSKTQYHLTVSLSKGLCLATTKQLKRQFTCRSELDSWLETRYTGENSTSGHIRRCPALADIPLRLPPYIQPIELLLRVYIIASASAESPPA